MKIRYKNGMGFVFLILGVVIFLINSFKITGGVIGYSDANFSFSSLTSLIFIGVAVFLFVVKEDLEAIVVPTGPSYEAGRQRAKGGAEEYSRHPNDVVIISGEFDNGKFIGSQPGKIYRILRKSGVPRRDIILENNSGNTIENVLYTCDEIKEKGINEVTVVSDRSHAARLKMLFGRAKKEGYAPKNLKVHTYSEGIKPSYGFIKSTIAKINNCLCERYG